MHRIVLYVALVCLWLLLAGCGAEARERAAAVTGGNPSAGAQAIERHGCGACHTIPGIPSAHGLAGPPLSGIGKRLYVAGELPNTPENLMHWIRHPREVNDRTVMPELGVTAEEARDIAALLYSLE
jgi:cytochrome c